MKSKVALVFLLLAVAGLSASAASPFKKTEGNRLLHVPSGIVFPGKIALFDRIDTKIFSPNGRDIRARYQLDAFILADVYVYPVGAPGYGKDLNGEFQVQQRAIREINKNVKLAAETTIQTTQNGRTITGRKAIYDLVRELFDEPPHQCGSQLIVFRDGPWFIAYRFSYPGERSTIAMKHIAAFLDQWDWRE